MAKSTSYFATVFGLLIAVLGVIIGVLNYSNDESFIYRFMFETELVTNSDNFYYGCFCFTNKLDPTPQALQIGDSQFCELNGCTNEIIILDNRFYKDLILKGDVGVGESYFDEYWTYNSELYDLGDVMTEFVMGFTNGTNSIFAGKYSKYLIVEQWNQWYARTYGITKTIEDDKHSVSLHYDIGNDLYEAFMDATMLYTCAFWGPNEENPNMNLFEAQNNKLDILTAKMKVTSDDHVLDIGSGWGYGAHSVNEKTNANVTGITISEGQFGYQKNKYGEYSTHEDNSFVHYRVQDYRDVDVLSKLNINKVMAIGMYEHVGIKNVNTFFGAISNIFEASMKLNKNANKSKDYIFGVHYFTNADITPNKIEINKDIACDPQTFVFKYIFPGACLIHPDWTMEAARNNGFITLHQEHFGIHYAKTLKIWRENWKNNFPALAKNSNNKYDHKLFLMYDIYFAFCEAMFRSGHIQLIQQIFIKRDTGGDENEVRKLYSRYENIEDQIVIPPRHIMEKKKKVNKKD